MTDSERLILIEHMANIKDTENGKRVEMDFHEWAWIMDLVEESLPLKESAIEVINSKDIIIRRQQKEIDSLTLDKGYLLEENKELKEKVRHYEMMYHNTGAMFNRMTMKEKIERYEQALRGIAESKEDTSCNEIALKYEVIADKALND